MREFMNVSLWFISSYFFFVFKELSLPDLLTLLLFTCGILLAWYYKHANMKFHLRIFNVIIGVSAAYIWKFGNLEWIIRTWNIGYLKQIVRSFGIFFLIVVISGVMVCIFKTIIHYGNSQLEISDSKGNSSHGKIFEERLDDCRRLSSLIRNFNVIGIDSPWGAGKTFLVNYFCSTEEVRKAYEVIRIPALSYNYDEYDYLILGEIDSILNANHIFSHDVINLRKLILESPVMVFLYKLFFGWRADSAIADFESIKTKVDLLDKKILIIFEDIERADIPSIQKIFSIGDRLAGDKIKVIYEYAGDKLDAKGINREYRNKYIYADMYLTSLSFKTLLNMYWHPLEMDKVKLRNRINLKEELFNMVYITNQRFVLSGNKHIYNRNIKFYPVRWFEHFLQEVKSYLQINPDVDQMELQVAIRMLFVKNTNFTLYDKFYGSKKLDELFTFKDLDGKELSLYEIISRKLEIESELRTSQDTEKGKNLIRKAEEDTMRYEAIINSAQNKESVYVFSLLEMYDLTQHIKWDNVPENLNQYDKD